MRGKIEPNPCKWKFILLCRILFLILLCLIFLYAFIINKGWFEVVVQETIEDTSPQQVWEFMSDFSNMMKLNPTIEEFYIQNESHHMDHWKYSVHYKEHLSTFKSIKNYGTGHYSVKQVNEEYFITSEHIVCFSGKLYCVNSQSRVKFSKNGTGTTYVEQVKYECPTVFFKWCSKEVMYQRNEIINGIKRHFST